ncbi:MAG: 1-acyl-sn-glycerol-3-phosphate acyltransferase [Bacteroidales bacterium]|nr:1-acyl-sn-glycerol-3-phosphate acyltransferase [Bacteroidales bacterium]
MKHIDLESTLRNNGSPLLRKLPGFIISILKKIVHEEEMNRLLGLYGNLGPRDFLDAILKEFGLKVNIEGIENLPEDGRCFFAGNHPFGIIDGLILTHTVSGKYGHLKAIGNDAFMYVPPLRPFIAAVNVYGRNQKEVVKQLDELFASDMPVTHFPAGEVSRIYKGKISDNLWQKSFITKSVAHRRQIVPFYFRGRNSILFYVVFIVRKVLGIKINIELILLPREMFKKRGKTLSAVIGKPVSYTSFDNRFTHNLWCEKIREYTYSLNEKPFRSFEEFLSDSK